jgi:hypothetical protein
MSRPIYMCIVVIYVICLVNINTYIICLSNILYCIYLKSLSMIHSWITLGANNTTYNNYAGVLIFKYLLLAITNETH